MDIQELTVEEARKLGCPFGKGIAPIGVPTTRCDASGCMAWASEGDKEEKGHCVIFS